MFTAGIVGVGYTIHFHAGIVVPCRRALVAPSSTAAIRCRRSGSRRFNLAPSTLNDATSVGLLKNRGATLIGNPNCTLL